jgi:hypothetical protein
LKKQRYFLSLVWPFPFLSLYPCNHPHTWSMNRETHQVLYNSFIQNDITCLYQLDYIKHSIFNGSNEMSDISSSSEMLWFVISLFYIHSVTFNHHDDQAFAGINWIVSYSRLISSLEEENQS